MKLLPNLQPSIALIACALLTAGALPAIANAAGENIGDTTKCIQISRVKSSPIIDDRTILVEMFGKDKYKRIDLASSCSGLEFSGFEVRLRQNRLCSTDTIVVRQNVGAVCRIDKIVIIDKAEAKALRAN